jgi:hypothetical protein
LGPNADPFNPKATLEGLKDRFREDMLGVDDFFAIVTKRLDLDVQTGRTGLPDFSLEPVLTFRGDREFWAVRLGYSRTTGGGPLTARVAVFDHVKLAECAPSQRMYQPEPELLAELESLGVTDVAASAENLIRKWIAGMDMLHSDPTVPVAINPKGGAVELLDELQRTAYMVEPTE